MQFEFDEESDALYIKVSDKPIAISEEVTPDIIRDISADGVTVGLDVQHASVVSSIELANALSLYG